ncbi:MAG: hypothetical protein NC102_03055 [Clostridium sp.]|nr:hypothetical protein [Clostridium sp.]
MDKKTTEINNQALAAEAEAAEKAAKVKKAIMWVTGIVAVVAIIALAWYFIAASNTKKANSAIAVADIAAYEMQPDSVQLSLYEQAAKAGSKSGDRASLEAAIRLYKNGEYEKALTYLNDASVSSDIVEAGRYSLMGDCYVNLNDLDKALNCYKKAVSAADNNPEVVPFVLVKEANIYREQKNYANESECYKNIIANYPQYLQTHPQILPRAERAKAAAK